MNLNRDETQLLGSLMLSVRNACNFELGNGPKIPGLAGPPPTPERAAHLKACMLLADKILHSIGQANDPKRVDPSLLRAQ